MFENKTHYPWCMRAIHHISALLVIILLAVGLYMSDLDKSDPLRATLFTWHKTIGWAFLWLVLWRLITKIRYQPNSIELPQAIKTLAALSHFGLYLCMFVMPLSGWLMVSAKGYPIKLFGIEALSIPNLIAKNPELGEWFEEVHEYTAWLLIALIALHAVGSIYHLVKKDGIWGRMWG